MIVLDFGGLKDGYGSDTTRTVHVGGEPSGGGARGLRDRSAAPSRPASRRSGPGVTCQEVDRATRQVIADAGYGEFFIHRTGHGIGLTTHEPPYMVEGERQPLVPGMCFSIEPGIYLPGRFGVRIEDIVTVTADGGRRLNNTTHELQIVARGDRGAGRRSLLDRVVDLVVAELVAELLQLLGAVGLEDQRLADEHAAVGDDRALPDERGAVGQLAVEERAAEHVCGVVDGAAVAPERLRR